MSANLIKEVNNVKAFFKAREGLQTGADSLASLRASFMTALVVQIKSLPAFGASDATALSDVLKDSPYGVEGTAKIVATIDARLGEASSAKPSQKAAKSNSQFLKQVWNFPTQPDWDILFNKKKSFAIKMSVVVERLNLVGCTHPDEQTLKWILAMLLLTHYEELPSAKVIYDKLLDLKDVVESERKQFPHEHLQVFPASPDQLPKAIYDYAYGASPPVAKEFDGISAIGDNCIPLRKNSKLLKRKKSDPDANVTWWDMKRLIKEEREKPQPHLVPPMGTDRSMIASSTGFKRSFESLDSCRPSCDPTLPRDSEERDLYTEYQAKLQQLRNGKVDGHLAALKREPMKAESPLEQPSPAAGLPINLSKRADGSLVLTPKARSFGEATKAAKREAEVGATAEAEVGATPGAGEDPLDEYAAAALNAFKQRNGKKKAAAAAKAKNARAKGKAKGGAACKKRPACKSQVKEDVDKKDIKKAMPKVPADGSSPNPVRYRGGVIYSSLATKAFRVLTTSRDKYSEKREKWQAAKPTKQAWTKAVKHIDDARKAE